MSGPRMRTRCIRTTTALAGASLAGRGPSCGAAVQGDVDGRAAGSSSGVADCSWSRRRTWGRNARPAPQVSNHTASHCPLRLGSHEGLPDAAVARVSAPGRRRPLPTGLAARLGGRADQRGQACAAVPATPQEKVWNEFAAALLKGLELRSHVSESVDPRSHVVGDHRGELVTEPRRDIGPFTIKFVVPEAGGVVAEVPVDDKGRPAVVWIVLGQPSAHPVPTIVEQLTSGWQAGGRVDEQPQFAIFLPVFSASVEKVMLFCIAQSPTKCSTALMPT